MTTSDCFVSVIAPLDNDADIVPDFIKEVTQVLKNQFANYELILVDDGSRDDTVEKVSLALKEYECMRLICLSRHFGTEAAISAGLDSAIGDYVVLMQPDSDPPEIIPEMVQLSRTGTGVVIGVRKGRGKEPFWAKLGAKLFYWYVRKVLHLNIPANSALMRVLSREAVNAITQVRDRYHYIRMISVFVGYSTQEYLYEPISRSGKHKHRSLGESINQAIDMVVINSTHPLRAVSVLGLLASLFNLLYMLYVIIINLVKDRVAEGWTTTSLQNAGIYFFILLILTVLSEYVGRILNEAKSRPIYYVLDEKNSSVMLSDSDRRNVVDDPLDSQTKTADL